SIPQRCPHRRSGRAWTANWPARCRRLRLLLSNRRILAQSRPRPLALLSSRWSRGPCPRHRFGPRQLIGSTQQRCLPRRRVRPSNQRSRERSPPHRLALRLSRWILEPCPRHRLVPRPLIELRRARSRPHRSVLRSQRSRMPLPLALPSSRRILELCPRHRLVPLPSIELRRERYRQHQSVLLSSQSSQEPCPLRRLALRSRRLILELCPRRRLVPPPSIGLRREGSP